MPKLSIVTINLNNKVGLLKTISSVIYQTFDSVEFIIIDGGSYDGSVEVIKQFSDRLTYWVSEPDKGIYNAMNKGIDVASGEYLQFLNSGDWLANKTVLSDIFTQIDQNYDLIFGNCLMVNSDGTIWVDAPVNKNIGFLTFFYGTINHQAAFFNSALFEKYGKYDESIRLAADWEFFFRTFGSFNLKTKYINTNICYYVRDGLSSSNIEKWKEEKSIIIKQRLSPQLIEHFEIFHELYVRNYLINRYMITKYSYIFCRKVVVILAVVITRIKHFFRF